MGTGSGRVPTISSTLERVEDRGPGQFQRTLMIVPQAVGRLMLLQGAADVVLAVNDGPAIADADAFQKRRHVAILGGLAGCSRRLGPAADGANGRAADLFAVQIVAGRDHFQLLVRE